MTHPFINVTVQTIPTDVVTTEKINTIYLVGTTLAGTIGDNKIKLIRTLTEFDDLIGANAPSRADYAFLRKIDPSVPAYFVNGRSLNPTPTPTDHLLAGFTLLSLNVRLPGGIIICPEVGALTAANSALVYTSAQNFVSNVLINWQYFHNTLIVTDTTAKAQTEKNTYTSPQGHSALFYGYGKDDQDNPIALSTVAAARMTTLNRRSGYLSPSAYQDPIPFKTVDDKYLPKFTITDNEFKILKDKNINPIYLDGDGINTGVYTICGARTLANDLAWRHINTRYAANNVFIRCSDILKPFLFLPADVNAVTNNVAINQENLNNADIILALRVLLDTMQSEGAFATPPLTDNTVISEPYEIRPSKSQNGDLQIEIIVSLVQTRETISINFIKRG